MAARLHGPNAGIPVGLQPTATVAAIHAMARPTTRRAPHNHIRPHWLAFEVTRAGEQVSFKLYQARSTTDFTARTRAPIFVTDTLRVTAANHFLCAGKPRLCCRRREEMNGHQAIGAHRQPMTAERFVSELQVELAVLRFDEARFPIVAALDNAIQGARRQIPGAPRHCKFVGVATGMTMGLYNRVNRRLYKI